MSAVQINLLILIVFGTASCRPVGADWQHYRLSALAEAQDRGMGILLHIDQASSSLCQSQKKWLNEMTRGDSFKRVAAFRVAYGSDPLFEQTFSVREPCSLLVFKGKHLIDRLEKFSDQKVLQISIRRVLP